jgi:hypothetical protein
LSAAQGILLGVGLATALLFAAGTWVVGVVFFAVFDAGEDDAADVQRFVALTEEARGLVPPGLPLFDADKSAATTEAIERFRAKKDEARPGTLGVARPPPLRHPSNFGRRGMACPSARNSNCGFRLLPPVPLAQGLQANDQPRNNVGPSS